MRARRRDQRGAHTYGDDADAALVQALVHVERAAPGDPARSAALRTAGADLGRHVYARRMFEDSFRGAFIVLSSSMAASGIGSLEVEDAFHREATVRLRAQPQLDGGVATCAFVLGILEGFLGEAFNCDARAEAASQSSYRVQLLDGRDANRRRSA